jgi:hypothetical protein
VAISLKRPLVGVRVECTARLTTITSHNQILIDAHKAFKLYAFDRYVYAAFRGDPSLYPGSWTSRGTGSGVDTYKDGIQFPGYRLTANKWVRLLFEHNGMTQMRLSIDGEPVTLPRGVLSGVPGVGPKGICIGNAVDGGEQPFAGEIDEVKVWRLDPIA